MKQVEIIVVDEFEAVLELAVEHVSEALIEAFVPHVQSLHGRVPFHHIRSALIIVFQREVGMVGTGGTRLGVKVQQCFKWGALGEVVHHHCETAHKLEVSLHYFV